jgi:hypothetical protein
MTIVKTFKACTSAKQCGPKYPFENHSYAVEFSVGDAAEPKRGGPVGPCSLEMLSRWLVCVASFWPLKEHTINRN